MQGDVRAGEQKSNTKLLRWRPSMELKSIPSSSTASEAGSSEEMRAIDCNLAALCQHIVSDGWNASVFSDIEVHCMGSVYHLHRLILSRSSYFRHMLQGSWKESSATVISLRIDDENVNGEAVAIALAYLYGHHPKLNDGNARRVLAAASFLDLQVALLQTDSWKQEYEVLSTEDVTLKELCAICTDFIISELWTGNFLAYQGFAESQDYGLHGERVRKACWGYLCREGAVELKEILPKLSTRTICTLLTSDELWIPSEGERFELAMYVLMSRGGVYEMDHHLVIDTSNLDGLSSLSISKNDTESKLISGTSLQSSINLKSTVDDCESLQEAHSILMKLADSVVDCCNSSNISSQKEQGFQIQPITGVMYVYRSEKPGSPSTSQTEVERSNACSSSIESRKTREASTSEESDGQAYSSCEGQVQDIPDLRRVKDQRQKCSTETTPSSSTERCTPSYWSKDGACMGPAWGGRTVGRRQIKVYPQREWENTDEWNDFISVFEGGGILYCHMAFEELLTVRARLEELAFPCKSVSDGLWLQTLLKQHVLTVVADNCKICGLYTCSCTCRQQLSYNYGRLPANFYRDEQDRNLGVGASGSFHVEAGRVQVRGSTSSDGLAGIGKGMPFGSPADTYPPSRFMFSRVPISGFGNRGGQQHSGNEQSLDPDGSADGLTVIVGLSQGPNTSMSPLHLSINPGGKLEDSLITGKVIGEPACASSSLNKGCGKPELQDQAAQDWDVNECSSIPLDLETPLRAFPPFRFGVEFDGVQRLTDGQSKHSPEVFYAGSLWKISVQAFHDEDPRGRRTLGLFLHRRRAENMDSLRKVYLYTDTREKVTARYQLICPSKREVMVFGSLTQAGTLLPKAPKGWGWRTAFLFDELPDLFQGGSLRVAAVVQVV